MSYSSRLPTLKQLRYLVALDRHQHFGRAAESCFVTQSTLSNGINELENLLGVQLVERTKRTVFMTTLGRAVSERARALLCGAEDIVDLVQSQTPLCGAFHLGVIPTISPCLFPHATPRLRQRFPELQLYLREDRSAQLLDALTAGELDAVLMAFPYDTENLDSVALGRDAFWLASASNKKPEQGENLILMEDGHCLREHSLSVCAQQKITPTRTVYASSLTSLIHMISVGLGFSLLPKLVCQSPLFKATDIELHPLCDSFRTIALAWRKGFTRKDDATLLASVLKEIINIPTETDPNPE